MKVNGPGWWKSRTRKTSLTVGEERAAVPRPIAGFNVRTLVSSGFPNRGDHTFSVRRIRLRETSPFHDSVITTRPRNPVLQRFLKQTAGRTDSKTGKLRTHLNFKRWILCFCFVFQYFIVLFWKSGSSYLGKARTAEQEQRYPVLPVSVCSVFVCRDSRARAALSNPTSISVQCFRVQGQHWYMATRIAFFFFFNVSTDSDACDCTRGYTEGVHRRGHIYISGTQKGVQKGYTEGVRTP